MLKDSVQYLLSAYYFLIILPGNTSEAKRQKFLPSWEFTVEGREIKSLKVIFNKGKNEKGDGIRAMGAE